MITFHPFDEDSRADVVRHLKNWSLDKGAHLDTGDCRKQVAGQLSPPESATNSPAEAGASETSRAAPTGTAERRATFLPLVVPAGGSTPQLGVPAAVMGNWQIISDFILHGYAPRTEGVENAANVVAAVMAPGTKLGPKHRAI